VLTIAERQRLLDDSIAITQDMRGLRDQISERNGDRRQLWRRLWREGGMSQTGIARACGVTGQTVWNEIHRESHGTEQTATTSNQNTSDK
jgi:IS30 family transposase